MSKAIRPPDWMGDDDVAELVAFAGTPNHHRGGVLISPEYAARAWLDGHDAAVAARTLARVVALPAVLVAAWLVGRRDGEGLLTEVPVVRVDDLVAALRGPT